MFLKYVWPFYNIMHETVKNIGIGQELKLQIKLLHVTGMKQ